MSRRIVSAAAVVFAAAALFTGLGGEAPRDSGTWVAAGPLSAIRTGGASVLANGRVIVLGGRNDQGPLLSAEVYSAGEWSTVDIPIERWGHTATALLDGRVLIAGGESPTGLTSLLDVFDPVSNTLTPAGTLSSPRTGHAAALLSDGRVLIAGGFDGQTVVSTIELFDPASGSISAAPFSLTVARAGLSATTLLDGRVLLAGGSDGADDLALAELFNVTTGAVSVRAMSAPRRDHEAVLLPHNNHVLLIGGASNGQVAGAELYRSWTGEFVAAAAPVAPRVSAAASPLVDEGWALVAGGIGQDSAERYAFATVKTDQDDYYPGQRVTMSGSGWRPGETVTLEVWEVPAEHPARAYTALAGSDGTFVNTQMEVEDHHLGVRFFLRATGDRSAAQAQVTFTDAVNHATSPLFSTVSGPPSSPSCGSTVTTSPVGARVCASSTISTNKGNTSNNFVEFRWYRQGQTTAAFIQRFPGGSETLGEDVSVLATNVQTPDQAGTWTVKVCQAGGGCTSSGNTLAASTILITSSTRTLTVSGTGAGVGTVTSIPAGINCTFADGAASGTCSASFSDGASVTLTAVPSDATPTAGGSTFDGWTGAGTGEASRVVTMDADTSVSARFKANQTVTFDPLPARSYGDASFTVAAGASSGLTVTFSSLTASVCGVAGTSVSILAQGTCTIEAAQPGDEANYNAAPNVSQSFSVAAKSVAGSFTAAHKEYDGTTSAQVLSRSLTGLLPEDAENVTLTGGSAAFNDANVGMGKTVTLSGATLTGSAAANYALAGVSTTTANISPKTVTGSFTASNKVYDGTVAATITGRSLSGAVGSDDVSLAGGSATFADKNVGIGKLVTGAGFALAGEASANYALHSATLTAAADVTPRAATVSADPKAKTYGDDDPALTYAVSPALVEGDAFTGGLTRAAGENVGTYTIQQGTLALNTNYTLVFVGADLTVGPRALMVTADARVKTYGDGDPALTYQITDGSLVFSDAFSGALTRDAGENVGTYPIRQGTLALSGNYDLSFAGADLTITRRAVTVTADAKAKIYGEADPALTYQVTSGSLAGTDSFSGALTRAPGENAGSYAVTQGTLSLNSNYSLTFQSANLVIAARPIRVTADPKSKVFGTADPTFTWQLTGGTMVGTDQITGSLHREFVGTIAGETVGVHPILIGSLTAGANYALEYVGANLTITAWTASGFYQPVSMTPGVWNTVKGGATVPLKFNLYTTAARTVELTSTSDVTGFTAAAVSCGSGAGEDAVDFVTTGGTSLRYDTTERQFVQNWQTPRQSGNCYRVTMTARDGSTISALFKTK